MLTVPQIAQKIVETYTPAMHCKEAFARKGAYPNEACAITDPEATQWCIMGYRDYVLYTDHTPETQEELVEAIKIGGHFNAALRKHLPHGLTVVWANDRPDGYDILMKAVQKVAEDE